MILLKKLELEMLLWMIEKEKQKSFHPLRWMTAERDFEFMILK